MKKMFYVISLLIIASMVLAACGTPAAPAATEAPAATVAPVATEAPAATAVPAPTEVPPTATAAPLKPGDPLPRTETLYFNGLQWGAVVCWNPYSSSCNNALALTQQDSARVTMFETPSRIVAMSFCEPRS